VASSNATTLYFNQTSKQGHSAMWSTLIQYTTEPLVTVVNYYKIQNKKGNPDKSLDELLHTAGTKKANKNISIPFPIAQEKNFSTPTPPTLMNKKMTATTVHSVCTNHAPEQRPMHSAAGLRHVDKPTARL
jgi:hypothetical protein